MTRLRLLALASLLCGCTWHYRTPEEAHMHRQPGSGCLAGGYMQAPDMGTGPIPFNPDPPWPMLGAPKDAGR